MVSSRVLRPPAQAQQGHCHLQGKMPGTLRGCCLLCREHPELSEGLCVEMMTRQLADSGGHTLQHQVLTALAPWMENLSFRPRWEGAPLCHCRKLKRGACFPTCKLQSQP